MSCCKFLIYWVGANTKFTTWQIIICTVFCRIFKKCTGLHIFSSRSYQKLLVQSRKVWLIIDSYCYIGYYCAITKVRLFQIKIYELNVFCVTVIKMYNFMQLVVTCINVINFRFHEPCIWISKTGELDLHRNSISIKWINKWALHAHVPQNNYLSLFYIYEKKSK